MRDLLLSHDLDLFAKALSLQSLELSYEFSRHIYKLYNFTHFHGLVRLIPILHIGYTQPNHLESYEHQQLQLGHS